MPAPVTPTQHILMLQSLQRLPAQVASVIEPLPAEAHDWAPVPGEWSARQTVSHLAAAEAPFYDRLNRIVSEPNPWLPYFGPDVARPDSPAPLSESLARFRAGRERLLAFLSTLLPERWDHPAIHQTQGPTTLARQVQNLLNHDLEHLGQLQVLKQAWDANLKEVS
jgi:uncharacterized damage-inducible protein DinB